jgi:Ca-activated chloride channel homolog
MTTWTWTMRNLSLAAALPAAVVLGCGGGGGADGGDDDGNVGFGGAQDIGQFRSILDQGEIPGEDTLDANGFFSEHYSPVPPADCGQVLCLAPMLSVGRAWLDGSYQATLQIAMTTPIDPATLERPPLNLVVVVDRSGSMASDGRMEKVKQGLHILVDSLLPGDRLALVQFDDQVDTLSTLDAEPDLEALHAQVTAMFPRGSTNIYGGLDAGFAIAATAWDPERQNRIMLLSDGLATAGVTDTSQIIEMADGYLADGMALTTIGVGLEFDVELMRGLAERGAGNFYFLEDAAAVDEVFTDELAYALTTLALDVRVNAVPAAGYRLGEVVGTRVWSSTSDGGEARIPAVFVASRDDQEPDPGRRGGGGSIFIDLTPLTGAVDDGRVAAISLSYRLPGTGETITQQVDITNPNPLGEAPGETYVSTQVMMEHYAAYNLYLGLRKGTRLAAYHYDCALSALTALRDSAVRFNGVFQDPDVTADIALIDQFSANLREKGARPTTLTQGQCNAYDPADPGYGDDYDGDDYDGYAMHCAAGGSPASGALTIVIVGAAVVAGGRRRRRR